MKGWAWKTHLGEIISGQKAWDRNTVGRLSQLERGQLGGQGWEWESNSWGQRFGVMQAALKKKWENFEPWVIGSGLLAAMLFIVWRKQRQSKKTGKEINVIMQTSSNGGLDLDGGSGGRERWSDSWYIFKITLTEFTKIWNMFVKGRREVMIIVI